MYLRVRIRILIQNFWIKISLSGNRLSDSTWMWKSVRTSRELYLRNREFGSIKVFELWLNQISIRLSCTDHCALNIRDAAITSKLEIPLWFPILSRREKKAFGVIKKVRIKICLFSLYKRLILWKKRAESLSKRRKYSSFVVL